MPVVSFVGRLWLLCFVIQISSGQYGTKSVKGGSSSQQSSWRFSQQQSEPLVTRSHYSQSTSQQISQRQCERPKEPEHGSVSCRLLNDKYTCTGKCEQGYKFPDGRETYILDCSKHTGQWTPYRNFPDCVGSYGGGGYSQSTSHQGSRNTGYSQTSNSGSYSRSFSQSSSGQSATSGGGGSNFGQYSSFTQGQGLCGQLKSPSYGSKQCSMSNGQWTCTATCNLGYEFPDGTRQTILSCHDRDGQWSPKTSFDDCRRGQGQETCGQPKPPMHGNHYCSMSNGQCQNPSSRPSSICSWQVDVACRLPHQETRNQDYTWFDTSCSGSGLGGGSGIVESCGQPKPPMHGSHYCSMSNGLWTCTGTCNPGYEFPDRTRQSTSTCHERDGRWSPKKDFDDCRLLCHPPCENGGRCSVHNQCQCPETHRGNRCQYAKSLCDPKRMFFGSVYSDCQHYGEYTECKISCPPGMTFDPPSSSVYRCTVDGLWNPPTAPTCAMDSFCEQPPNPTNGHISCQGNTEIMICTGTCQPGYIFKDGFTELAIQCVRRTGEWTPTVGFPDCEPICSPECLNGGRCIGHNSCLCPKEYRGSRCEYAYSNCDGHDRFASVGWKCEMTQKETICNVSCPATGTKLQPSLPTTYICSLDGTWQPDLKPICVQDARSTQFENYQNGQQGTGWQQNRGAYNHQMNRHRENLGGYRNFEGQQQMDYDFDGQQPVDYDFGGQQQIDHDFGGQRQVGNGFGGQQQIGHDLGGQRPANFNFQRQHPIGNEFGGQQSVEDDEDDTDFRQQISEEPLQKVHQTFEEAQKRPTGHTSDNIQDSRHRQGLEDFNVNLPPAKKDGIEREIDDKFQLPDRDTKEIIKELVKVSNYRGICSTWGFYHYRTFDGGVYTFPSTCWYVLATSSADDLAISVKTECSGRPRCSRIVAIQHANHKYLLSYSNGLVRDGEQLAIPIQDENLIVEYVSRYLVAKTQFGYTIWINEENTVLVVAESYVKTQTAGMCGNYDGVSDPLFLARDGTKTPDIFAFTTSWKVENNDGTCVDEAEQTQPCSSETREKRMESDKANLACAAFYDAQFEKCSLILDVDVYYLQCQMDCCSMSSVEDCECTSLGEFVLECSRAGVDMSKGWRQPGLCPLSCTNGTEYNECGPACPPTCADQQPVCNIQKCVDGCHCPKGTLLEGGQCILADECPCHYASQHYPSGETMQQDCNACVCQGGNWKCTDSICPSTCSVSGPHFTTFDGFGYDFQGRCSYYLVDSNEFSVKVDYSTSCREQNTVSGVCIKSITIHTPEEAVVKLKPSMEITVNGREMTSLPVIAPGIYIGQSTSKYVRAQLSTGIEILWDLDQNIQVFAPTELFGMLRGLCGTFTKSRQDELLTPEGDIEASVGAFVQKWKVEESCKDVKEPTDLEGGEKACDTYSERRAVAAEACNILKGPAFKECHDLLDYERYYADCMEDVCSCEDDPVTCSCLSLANFANACARKGKPLSWRQSVPACGIACPPGQIYQACADPCSYTCGEIAHMHSKCKDICVEGCVCPPGQTLNEHRQCIPVSSCSCIHSGHYYPPEFLQRRGKEMCACSQGHWDCHEATAADLILTPPPNVATECDPSAHEVATDCVSDCPLTCTNYHHHEPCTVAACFPGCRCQNGYVLDTSSGICVEPRNCPCHHGGRSYEEGEQVTMDCNTCVCEGGSWKCDSNSCPGICSSWGDSHFETFDGNLYDFEGTCEYVLVKARISDNEFFSVVTQNVPCGLGSEANCGKAISVTLGDSSVSLTRVHPIPSVPENSRLKITPVGMFTLVESDIGISVQWDRNTRVYVTAQPIWKNKLQGLCGDFNSDASDDFRSPSGGIPLVLAKDFADSWRVHKFCPKAKPSQDACNKNPERRIWSRHRCGVLKSDLFKPCHYQVEVEDYYKRCVSDACACSTGGDCKCVCAVIAAYALKCARSGVVIQWRSQDLCPVQCETCDRYSPCISMCQPVNCDTYLVPLESQSCSREYCVDGCTTKPCKPGHVHRSATNLTCIPEEMCDDKPCIVIDGVSYREGERIEDADIGDACQSCYCKNGKVDCVGVPCTYSTLQPIPTFIDETPCEFTGWTEWINSMDPEDNDGNDSENLEKLVETHRIPCPLDHVRSIQCRSVDTQEPAEATGQNVTCSIPEGLACRQKARTGYCEDYEIRVFCQCHEEVTCPPEQEWKECAFDCEHSCHSLVTDMRMNSLCEEGEKCTSGCVKAPCELPFVARDAETCVTPDQCTCKLETGYILAPGQVIANGCEKCQCLNNTLICSTTLDCKQPEEVLDEIGPYSENVPYIEVVTLKPGAKGLKPDSRIIGPTLRRPSTPSSRGLVIASTTPACSYWSKWINKAKPKKGRKHGEKEDTRAYIVKQTEGFCKQGSITAIECRDVETDQDYTQTNEEKLICSLNRGFNCQNRHQPDSLCRDYKIRYFCSCGEEPTPVPLFIKTTTQAYIYPCSEFVPMIDGPNPLPDTSLKASSSISSNSGPDASRFKETGFKGIKKAWTPAESNEKQFIEVDLGDVRAVYGIITKGKESSNEWVTSYQLLYSPDGASYSYYQDESDNNKVFRGNYDGSTETKHVFKRPFEAKLVRLEPLSWEKKISLRLELLGCSEALTTPIISIPEEEEDEERMSYILPVRPITTTPPPKECLEPIGLENGALLDSQLSASSSYSSAFTPENARLGSDSVWVSAFADDDQYLQLVLIKRTTRVGCIWSLAHGRHFFGRDVGSNPNTLLRPCHVAGQVHLQNKLPTSNSDFPVKSSSDP
ncbi:SCO-spondin [Nephila pilipes]|uniref:SCO-spondin n=1 Tax=Nephila pilipes TaxID=299642 RepID=A0A8X6P7S3_NEPPI|nr:SCO-spondin [Nephila pilipes]